MALQKPVIATKVGGIPEVVRDGIDGFLVNSGDINGVLESMLRLMDADLRAQMGISALESVKRRFSLQKQAESFCQQLDTLLDK
jgi:glycosyltransferase involved in cell wall biosynthesis